MREYTFNIADLDLLLRFTPSDRNGMWLLPSFKAFSTDSKSADLLFSLTIDDGLQPARERTLIRTFDTGNGETTVFQLPDGGYQYVIHDIYNRACCLLTANKGFTDCYCALNGDWVMRSFGLNNALMLIFAFAGSYHQTVLIHASCVMIGNRAFPFIAKSGTGKSTHSSLWMKHIEGAELLNDDNPVIRIGDDGQPYIYGSPWSGKTPCYRHRKAHLAAITHIERAQRNSIERLGPIQAFSSMLTACSSMKWDKTVYGQMCDTVTRIIETTDIYTLHCLPDEEASRLCYETLNKQR